MRCHDPNYRPKNSLKRSLGAAPGSSTPPSTTSRGYQWTLIHIPPTARFCLWLPGASSFPRVPLVAPTGQLSGPPPGWQNPLPRHRVHTTTFFAAVRRPVERIKHRAAPAGPGHRPQPFRPLGRYDAVLIAASAQPPPRVCPGRSAGSFAYSPQQPPLRTSSFQHPASPTGRSAHGSVRWPYSRPDRSSIVDA